MKKNVFMKFTKAEWNAIGNKMNITLFRERLSQALLRQHLIPASDNELSLFSSV